MTTSKSNEPRLTADALNTAYKTFVETINNAQFSDEARKSTIDAFRHAILLPVETPTNFDHPMLSLKSDGLDLPSTLSDLEKRLNHSQSEINYALKNMGTIHYGSYSTARIIVWKACDGALEAAAHEMGQSAPNTGRSRK